MVQLPVDNYGRQQAPRAGRCAAGRQPVDVLAHAVRAIGADSPALVAYGRAPGRREITISFDFHRHQVPVSRYGVWAFIKTRTSPAGQGFRSPVA